MKPVEPLSDADLDHVVGGMEIVGPALISLAFTAIYVLLKSLLTRR